MLRLHSTTARGLSVLLLAVILFAPATARAYLLPEDVLLGNDLYIPPRTRDASQRAEDQAAESAARREAEQAAEFERQHPAPPSEPETSSSSNYDIPIDMGVNVTLGSSEMELLRTIRLLERVDQNQYIVQHSGAPQPLAPTGAGGVIAVMTMMGAVGWTLRKAGKRMGWTSREF
ncbi:hypothetical protein KKC44_06250 [Patescibacteria group bacterium]|nr:hypothetical protein [Patescibacteria group bacterium]MBU2260170.1 hypothetical protein [Patescibacteria group bacterium]